MLTSTTFTAPELAALRGILAARRTGASTWRRLHGRERQVRWALSRNEWTPELEDAFQRLTGGTEPRFDFSKPAELQASEPKRRPRRAAQLASRGAA